MVPLLLAPFAVAPAAAADTVRVDPRRTTAAATVSERFLSFAVDMDQLVGGTFWDPAGGLERLGPVRVDSIMSRPPITLLLEATLDDALLLFDRHRTGALGVIDHDGLLVGIVTVRDVLAAYRRLFGIGTPGSTQVEVRDDGRPLLLTRIVRALEDAGTACTRLIRKQEETAAVVYVRVQTYNLHAVREALRAAGLDAVSPKGTPAP